MTARDALRRYLADRCGADQRGGDGDRTSLARGAKPSSVGNSHWTVTEFSSAISIKVRTGEISPEQRPPIVATFNSMIAGSLTLLTVSSNQFVVAAQFLENHLYGLRAGDALHLTIASVNGATVQTLDKHMATAGSALGIPTLLL